MSDKSKVRLSLAMPPATKAKIDELQERVGAPTVTEVIRQSIALLDTITAEQGRGAKIIIRDDDGDRQLMLL